MNILVENHEFDWTNVVILEIEQKLIKRIYQN